MAMRVTAYNPVRPYIGAPLGALAGSIAGCVALAVGVRVSDKAGVIPDTRESMRRIAGAASMVITFGSVLGAYLGAAPHQRVAAAIGAGMGGAAGGGALFALSTNDDVTDAQAPWLVALGWAVAPVAGAAAGASIAGTSAPASFARLP